MTELRPRSRIESIDFMRGLVIVIMAIDHIRDLLHTTSLTQDPLDLATTTPALFMTRWVTHLCAPVFVFLAGTSAYLSLSARNDRKSAARFLRERGLLLMVLELTVIGFGIWFDIYFRTLLLQVIFAIGAGFFILSFLLKLPARTLGFIGLGIIVFHNLTPLVSVGKDSFTGFLWSLLLDRGFFKLGETHGLMVGYPVIPWLGILLAGYGFGVVFTREESYRRRTLWKTGLAALSLFVILRSVNIYGDRKPWSVQDSFLHSVFSFIDVTKYPPSLLYASLMLSLMFFILYLADGKQNRLTRFFITYGRVPMFFYILHWYLIHISMFVMLYLQGVAWNDLTFGIFEFGRPASGVGLELPGLYLYWAGLILGMFPLCRWYDRYKSRRPDIKWLKYL
jgi:uncharacterized membrane protein